MHKVIIKRNNPSKACMMGDSFQGENGQDFLRLAGYNLLPREFQETIGKQQEYQMVK
jgi:hypothetical protein